MVTLPYPMTLIAKEETGSTNDDAKLLAENNADDLTVVWALKQTAGRGRLGRVWHSQEGNLLWSAIVKITHGFSNVEAVSFVVALAVRDAVTKFLPSDCDVRLKWPNDVLINDRKVSGTLIEGGVDAGWIVVGVGINLATAPDPAQTLYTATCMQDEGATCSLDELCLAFSTAFLKRISSWRDEGVSWSFINEYKSHLWRVGKKISVSFDAQKTMSVEGINMSIDSDFSLKLQLEDGTVKHVYAGDVLFPKS